MQIQPKCFGLLAPFRRSIEQWLDVDASREPALHGSTDQLGSKEGERNGMRDLTTTSSISVAGTRVTDATFAILASPCRHGSLMPARRPHQQNYDGLVGQLTIATGGDEGSGLTFSPVNECRRARARYLGGGSPEVASRPERRAARAGRVAVRLSGHVTTEADVRFAPKATEWLRDGEMT